MNVNGGVASTCSCAALGSKTGEPVPTYAPDGTWTGYLRGEDGKPVLSALTEQNEVQLKKIAEIGKGTYLRAKEGTVGIDQILVLTRGMKQAENRARKVSIAEDRYAFVLLPALLLLLLEALLPEAWYVQRRAATAQGEPS